MKSKMGGSWISLCLVLVICGVSFSLQAKGQQSSKGIAATNNISSQGQSAPAAIENAQGNQPIVLPIVGKGTSNFLPVWTGNYTLGNSLVSQTGNGISVSGTVSAVSFSGGGSGLSNVNASTLGGVSSSAFAQTAASNNFTADQTITGNLNLTGSINSAFSLQGNLTDASGQEGANVIGGFAGNAAFGGNSIAAGVIGGTIGGGGGVYDPSLLPRQPALKQPLQQSSHPALHNPSSARSLQGGSASAEPSKSGQSAPPPGLVSGSNSVQSDWATVAGGLQNTSAGPGSVVAGGWHNYASGDYATVSGGNVNSATDTDSTVVGGVGSTAGAIYAVVGGGFNSVTSAGGTVAGGTDNVASSVTLNGGSTVSGGSHNTASGDYSTVPGGVLNSAAGAYSFAAGCDANALYEGSFVWNSTDGQGNCIQGTQDTAADQFVVQAAGGFYFYTSNSSFSGSGAYLAGGSGSWSSLSDRNAKANFLAIDPSALLQKLAAMPIAIWNYKTQSDSIHHLGPTAQDFHAAFGLGEDDKHISTVDAEGVALAGIQALYSEMRTKLDEMNGKFAEMQSSLAEKDHQITELRERLPHVEQFAGTR